MEFVNDPREFLDMPEKEAIVLAKLKGFEIRIAYRDGITNPLAATEPPLFSRYDRLNFNIKYGRVFDFYRGQMMNPINHDLREFFWMSEDEADEVIVLAKLKGFKVRIASRDEWRNDENDEMFDQSRINFYIENNTILMVRIG